MFDVGRSILGIRPSPRPSAQGGRGRLGHPACCQQPGCCMHLVLCRYDFGQGVLHSIAWHTLAMLTVILIRPGSTDFDEQGRIQGTLDVPLNEHGGEEAAKLAADLRGRKLETLYHSACSSAQQTAEALAAALELKPKRLDHLQNLNHGLWQGMRVEEVKRKHPKVYRQ